MEAGPLILGRAPLFGDVSCYLLLEREKKTHIYMCMYVSVGWVWWMGVEGSRDGYEMKPKIAPSWHQNYSNMTPEGFKNDTQMTHK